MAYLYLELLKDSLNEYAYAAELAGLNYDLQNTVYGMYVSIHCFPLSPCSLLLLRIPDPTSPTFIIHRKGEAQPGLGCLSSVSSIFIYLFYTVETLNRCISCGKCNLYLLLRKS